MARLKVRVYRYPGIVAVAAVLAAAAPPSCEEPCDLCTVTNAAKWPQQRGCLTGDNDAKCTNDCERCMRTVYFRFGLQCSNSWSAACAQHAALCNPSCGGD
jgi:hypothetical protein